MIAQLHGEPINRIILEVLSTTDPEVMMMRLKTLREVEELKAEIDPNPIIRNYLLTRTKLLLPETDWYPFLYDYLYLPSFHHNI